MMIVIQKCDLKNVEVRHESLIILNICCYCRYVFHCQFEIIGSIWLFDYLRLVTQLRICLTD